MPNKLPPFLTANRIVAIIGVLTGLSAFITGLVKVLPGPWQSYALSAVGVIGTCITVLKFLEGSQKWDQLMISLERVRSQSLDPNAHSLAASDEVKVLGPVDEKDEFADTPFKLDPPEARGLTNVPDEQGPELEGNSSEQTSQPDESPTPTESSTSSTSAPESTVTPEAEVPWWKGKPGIDPGISAESAPSGQIPPVLPEERELTPEELTQVQAFADSLRHKSQPTQTPPTAGGQ